MRLLCRLILIINVDYPHYCLQEGTAEEFFIDMILARHARKLLTAGSLTDLGRFCAHLDFHLVTWLR